MSELHGGDVIYWRTEEAHYDNNETMQDFLDNTLPSEAVIDIDDGTYAEVTHCGERFALHASGDGDSYHHKVEIVEL